MKDADQFLVEQFQSGDRGAFDALVQRHYRRIYDYAYYFTHDVEEAYDITQEVFLRAFKALNGFKGDSSFYTWLYKIATNACIDHRRRRRVYRRVALYEDLNVEAGLDRMPDRERLPDEQVLDLEIDEQIKQAVRQLPEKQRQVFILRHFEGLSLQEIADILNRELGTVKAHLFHATRKMRRLLAPYLEEVAVGGHEEG